MKDFTKIPYLKLKISRVHYEVAIEKPKVILKNGLLR